MCRLTQPRPVRYPYTADGTGEAEGSFAWSRQSTSLCRAGMDPIELRAESRPRTGSATGSSNALLDCYRQGAERFGWSRRNPEPRSMRNGGQLVGYGVARGALLAYQPPCKAIASIRRDGTAFVRSGATDIGPGPYTVMTMLAADCLGVPSSACGSVSVTAPCRGAARGDPVDWRRQRRCGSLSSMPSWFWSMTTRSPLEGCRSHRKLRRHPHAAWSG
jgi:CO/xanthine dehydrogenase Mo-binding subunit